MLNESSGLQDHPPWGVASKAILHSPAKSTVTTVLAPSIEIFDRRFGLCDEMIDDHFPVRL